MATIEQHGHYTTAAERAQILELRYMDGLSIPRVAELTGRHPDTIKRHAPGWPGKIDNTRLRDAFLASRLEAVDVARSLDWVAERRGRLQADGSRLRRTLGLQKTRNGQGRVQYRKMIDAETAALIADAIGVAPWSVGCHDA
jgi:hypothetical protein